MPPIEFAIHYGEAMSESPRTHLLGCRGPRIRFSLPSGSAASGGRTCLVRYCTVCMRKISVATTFLVPGGDDFRPLPRGPSPKPRVPSAVPLTGQAYYLIDRSSGKIPTSSVLNGSATDLQNEYNRLLSRLGTFLAVILTSRCTK